MKRTTTSTPPAFGDELLAAWTTNNRILLDLLAAIPPAGLQAIPTGSHGRTVAEQFHHLCRLRIGWLAYHKTGKRARLPRVVKGEPIPVSRLRRDLAESGIAVRAFLKECFSGNGRVRMFGGSSVRWMLYLIAHESHHRGSIMLALKQNKVRLPKDIPLRAVWLPWFRGEH